MYKYTEKYQSWQHFVAKGVRKPADFTALAIGVLVQGKKEADMIFHYQALI